METQHIRFVGFGVALLGLYGLYYSFTNIYTTPLSGNYGADFFEGTLFFYSLIAMIIGLVASIFNRPKNILLWLSPIFLGLLSILSSFLALILDFILTQKCIPVYGSTGCRSSLSLQKAGIMFYIVTSVILYLITLYKKIKTPELVFISDLIVLFLLIMFFLLLMFAGNSDPEYFNKRIF